MALATSGEISIGGSVTGRSINLEFGRSATAQTSMSQLYRGGGIVPNAPSNNAIATAGAISLSQFYGATNRVQVNITISSNQTNYVLNTAKAAGYVAGITDVTVTINSGVYVSSSSTGTYALDVDTSWAAGDTVTIVNNGFILGMGGAGGAGRNFNAVGTPYSAGGGAVGGAGGPALRAQRAVSINNVGTIGGGGGGGGGGASGWVQLDSGKNSYDLICAGGGGGGGQSGTLAAAAGAGGTASGSYFRYNGSAGQQGTASSRGTGGAGGTYSASYKGGNGGNGGVWGQSGAFGSATTGLIVVTNSNGLSGGAGGAAVNGNGNITWVATGTRLGAIS